ncbi:MAG: hypothetical protein QXG03_09445 [Halalkalicoccus sp.]
MTRRTAMTLAGLTGLGIASGTATAGGDDASTDGGDDRCVIDGEELTFSSRILGASLAPEIVEENEGSLPDGTLERGDLYFQFAEAAPWSVKHGEFTGAQFYAESAGENIRSTEFSPDGTRMFQLSREDERGEPWAVTTAEKIGHYEFDGDLDLEDGWTESSGHGLWLRNGGGKRMYVWNRRELYQYDIEGWDVTTAELVGFRNFEEEMTRGHDLDFKPDGSRLYIDDREERAVFQWVLDENWDVETAELGYRLDISDNENAVRGLEFDESGTRLFLVDTGLRQVHEYHLGTAWKLSTAAFSGDVLDLKETTNPRSITWRRDGTRFFITDNDTGDILKYEIEPGSELVTMHVRGANSWARIANR